MNSTITFPAMGRTGTLKIRSFGDAAFGNIPDKDPAKTRFTPQWANLCVWKERREPPAEYPGHPRKHPE